MRKHRKEYAIYRGEQFLFIGNAKECTEFLGCSPNTFRFYLTPAYRKRVEERKVSENYIFVVPLDDEDEEGEKIS